LSKVETALPPGSASPGSADLLICNAVNAAARWHQFERAAGQMVNSLGRCRYGGAPD